jgi:hypothetical protein
MGTTYACSLSWPASRGTLEHYALFFEVRTEKAEPALLDVLAAAVRAQNLAFLVIYERQDLLKDLLALVAEEFVVGHRHLPQFLKSGGENLRPWRRRIQYGSGPDIACRRR